jgi:CTP:molybdopterin cytidylyltransferase MocA
MVLAAGEGTRFGFPKGLARTPDGTPWLALAERMLRLAGCDDVIVLVGARGDEVAALADERSVVVRVDDWEDGLAATLRAGVAAAARAGCDIAVITPVDTPDAPADAVRRLLAITPDDPATTLTQAVYRGAPGHPVLIGRDHFAALTEALTGDRGARAYLTAHGAIEVECADLWSGADIDRR